MEPAGVEDPSGTLRKELFIELTYGLGACAVLTAMHEGLNAAELSRAAEVAFRWLDSTQGIRLEVWRPFESRRFRRVGTYVSALQELVARPQTGVIIAFQMPAMAHWSVIKSASPELIRLRGSGRINQLNPAEFALNYGALCFRPEDTLVVTMEGAA